MRPLAQALARWFPAHARDLPWRRTLDPYAVWISEIMLQQTQVKTVIPYWERWMRALPDARALARAPEETVLKLWEGLGYYRRVRLLQSAARTIVAKHQGQFPQDFDAVLALPGIGPYTAGAITSIAFNQPRPILDGNVIRVLTRLFGIEENARARATNDRLWSVASALVEAAAAAPQDASTVRAHPEARMSGACSVLNQSLMELGALICTPRQPRCNECPVRGRCAARREGRVAELPNLGSRVAVTDRRFIAFALAWQDRWLVRQRPAGVVNECLWEFPNAEITAEPPDLAGLAGDLVGTAVRDVRPFVTVRHSITRYRIRLEAFTATTSRPANRHGAAGHWLTLKELQDLPFSSAHRRILRSLAASELDQRHLLGIAAASAVDTAAHLD